MNSNDKVQLTEFLSMCENDNPDIARKISMYSFSDKARIKANLKKKIVNADKWNLLKEFLVIEIAFIPLMQSLNGAKIGWCTVYGLMIMAVVIIVACLIYQHQRAKYEKALCYLEEYARNQG